MTDREIEEAYTKFYIMNLKDKTLMNGEYLNKIIHGDSLQVLSALDNNSIDLVLTDPPYFFYKIDYKIG